MTYTHGRSSVTHSDGEMEAKHGQRECGPSVQWNILQPQNMKGMLIMLQYGETWRTSYTLSEISQSQDSLYRNLKQANWLN